jgi:hypothetical protein
MIAVALLLIERYSPATGYELSIYEALPAAVWVCSVAALGGGTVIVVHQAFAGRRSKYWALGFAILVLGTLVILLLPVFRAYFAYGYTDPLNHAGETETVLSEHQFAKHLMYPLAHILMAQLSLVSGVGPMPIVRVMPPFFTVLFMLFGYLLASTVMPKKGQALLSVATTALFFGYYHVSVYPQVWAVMTMPLVFYLYFKGFGISSMPFRIAFVILLLQLTYFHPAPAGVLIVCLLATEVAKILWRTRRGTSDTAINDVLGRITLGPTLISSVAFLTWISSYWVFTSTIYKIMAWLTGELRTIPRVAEVGYIAESQGLSVQQQIELALKMYGDNLVYVSLSAIALVIIAWGFLRRRDEVKKLLLLSMPFVISGPAWVLIFAGTLWVTVGRLLGSNIMMWATPVLAAFALFWMFGRWKRTGVIIVTCILLCTSLVSILGVYHSPYILGPSWQVTRQDVQGTEWFSAHKPSPTTRGVACLGVPGSLASGRVPVPDHFGYAERETVGEYYPSGFYLVLARRFEVAATDPTLSKAVISDPTVARRGFDGADFRHLEQDSSATSLYSNGEVKVYLVNGER